jgi:ABC-2 type transport system ATP-binding protein
MSDAVLEVRGLSKSYPHGFLHRRRLRVLNGVSLTVRAGQIFGYLGPNGSGKTTTLKIVMGLLRADQGSVSVFGHSLADRAWRYRTGYLPEYPYLYDYLTAGEYLDYVGRLYSMPPALRRERARKLLAMVGLERSIDVPLRRFSKGMVQRAGLAQALMSDPDFVVLDEPMSGLDPIGRRLVRDLILDLKKAGKTILFSTHILSDAEALCDEVAVVRAGELLQAGRVSEILKVDASHMEVLIAGVDGSALGSGVRACTPVGERWRLEVDTASLTSVLVTVERGGGRILSVQPIRQSLEDYFFDTMGSPPEAGTWMPAD